MIRLEQLATRLIQFKSTHSEPDQMAACLAYCAHFFADTKAIVKQYESNGVRSLVIQTKDTTAVDVLLLGHIDTIDGPDSLFLGTVQDGALFGRGSLDMKAFVATSMMTLRELLDSGYDGNIAVAIVSDEELGGSNGARYLVEEIGYTAQVVLVPDDGEHIQHIVVESKHILQYKFSAVGKEAHGCQPWYGSNAIVALLETYHTLATHFSECHSATEETWVNTINLGTVQGGVAANEVPAHAEMIVDIRITKDTSKERIAAWVQDACASGVTATLMMEGFPTIVSEDDPVLLQYATIVEDVTGAPVRLIRSGGGTDGRYFAARGMKVIVHQGTGGDCQGESEHVLLDSLKQLVDIQKQFILLQ